MWQIDGNTARFESNGLRAKVDLLRPSRGIFDIRINERAVPHTEILGVDVDLGEPQVESYIRATDLIASYSQAESRTTCPQIYWRVLRELPRPTMSGFELIISMQTSLLDSDPTVQLVSRLPMSSVLRWSGGSYIELAAVESTDVFPLDDEELILVRLPGDVWSYTELVHPEDVVSAKLSVDDSASQTIQITRELFAGRLEKGVIRRGQVRGMFLPREDDQSLAIECLRQLTVSEPPLTA